MARAPHNRRGRPGTAQHADEIGRADNADHGWRKALHRRAIGNERVQKPVTGNHDENGNQNGQNSEDQFTQGGTSGK